MFQQTEGVSGDSIMHRNVNGRSMKSLGDVVSGKSKRLCKTNETCRALKPHTITQGSNPTNIPCNLKKSFFSSHLRHKIQQKSFFFLLYCFSVIISVFSFKITKLDLFTILQSASHFPLGYVFLFLMIRDYWQLFLRLQICFVKVLLFK